MWCTSSDAIDSPRGIPKPHHRIVRIPPGEAVVLNSAERAPYLLLIEILVDDLDFDPSRRNNQEILRKVVSRDSNSRTLWTDVGSTTPVTARPPSQATEPERTPFLHQTPFLPSPLPVSTPASSTFSNDDEEIDLIEQLFGDDEPLKSRILNIEDSIVMPPTPKNKELDMVAWSRSSPAPSMTPSLSNDPSLRPPQIHSRSLSDSNSLHSKVSLEEPNGSEHQRTLSLDEYSERMRTAAIMLAQLNADSTSSNATRSADASKSFSAFDPGGAQSSV